MPVSKKKRRILAIEELAKSYKEAMARFEAVNEALKTKLMNAEDYVESLRLQVEAEVEKSKNDQAF